MNKSLVKKSQELIEKTTMSALEKVLIKGDLAGLTEPQRVAYVKAVCKAIGVSPLFQPFDYITFQGKLVLYAKRACTEQLRNRRKISIKIISRERIDGLYVVTAQARDKDGREDESIGAVNIKGLAGKDLENAMMRGETKAKRRVTLSICGLGIMDEVETEEIAKKEAKIEAELAADASEAKLAETTERPAFETEPQSPSMASEAPHENEYVLKAGKLKGKTLKQVPFNRLEAWLEWYDGQLAAGKACAPEVQDDAFHIRPFLEEAVAAQEKSNG